MKAMTICRSGIAAICAFLLGIGNANAQFTLLHSFGGEAALWPRGDVTFIGDTLYGMTHRGGLDGQGIVFKMKNDGTGFGVLHNFNALTDGSEPHGSLVWDGFFLYGLTRYGGVPNNQGVVFKMDADGNNFSLLRELNVTDGVEPLGSLTLVGSTLYGMTSGGGANSHGTVFTVNTDGSDFQVLHDFTGGDGRSPLGSLTAVGSWLYGMTAAGGEYDRGILFRMNRDGSAYTVLHEFNGDDGSSPQYGALLAAGSTLYGLTRSGGLNDKGTLFKINDDGTGYSVLYAFGNFHDAAEPYGSLTLVGSTLYGMTSGGGDAGRGTVFQVNTDGSGYALLHEFAGGDYDGQYPFGSLVLQGSTLYGMTQNGGAYGTGTLFSLAIPEPLTVGTLALGALLLWSRRRHRGRSVRPAAGADGPSM